MHVYNSIPLVQLFSSSPAKAAEQGGIELLMDAVVESVFTPLSSDTDIEEQLECGTSRSMSLRNPPKQTSSLAV